MDREMGDSGTFGGFVSSGYGMGGGNLDFNNPNMMVIDLKHYFLKN